jgi:hypothetical protein
MPAKDLYHDAVKSALLINTSQIALLVVDVELQEIVQWIS